MSSPIKSAARRRRGYTLLELIITLGTGAILMAGLTSALVISTKTLTPDATASAENNRCSLALSQLTGDLRLALGFTERTTKAVTFAVPDRTGDSAVETIRYSWSGVAGDPLVYQFNGGTAVNLATNVQAFNLSALTRTIAAASVATPLTIVYQAPHAETAVATAGTSVTITTPAGLVPGHLMLAAMAIDGNVTSSLAAPSGWTIVNLRTADSAGQVTLAVYWKIATASEPSNYSFTWTGSKKAYAWIMRFSGVESSGPINVAAFTAGPSTSTTPPSPTVTTSVANAMIVRIGAFDNGGITIDSPGLTGHTAVTMDRSDAAAGNVSGGAGYVLKPAAGATGTSNFAISPAEEYVTCTIALVPEDGL
jgi:type II secretory pathway pseudopilin PulG